MTPINCVIQADSAADRSRARLEERLAVLHATLEPPTDITVTWRAMPAGWMFTEGRQSTSAVIAATLDRPTSLTERETYMRSICDLWTEITGCTDHEIVVAVTKLDPVKES